MSKLIFEEETYSIIGACFEVYKEKGAGFLEAVYQECLEIELGIRAVPFKSQTVIALCYKGTPLEQGYRADLICNGKILVEIKAVSSITDEHRSQLLNYLNATGLKVGLIVNFGHSPKLEYERFVV